MNVGADLSSVSKTVALFLTTHFLVQHGCGWIGEWRMRLKPTSVNVWFSLVFMCVSAAFQFHHYWIIHSRPNSISGLWIEFKWNTKTMCT